jgi:hypothetical protein
MADTFTTTNGNAVLYIDRVSEEYHITADALKMERAEHEELALLLHQHGLEEMTETEYPVEVLPDGRVKVWCAETFRHFSQRHIPGIPTRWDKA